MTELEIRLRCTKCREYTAFTRDSMSSSVVRCDHCGKRHSTDSLFAIEDGETPEFPDE